MKQIISDKDANVSKTAVDAPSNKPTEVLTQLIANDKQTKPGNAKLEEVLKSLELGGSDVTNAVDADELFAKLIERLDGMKNRIELLSQVKSLAEKNTAMLEMIDQFNTKNQLNALDRNTVMSATPLTDRTAVPLQNMPQQLVLQTQVNHPQWGSDFSKRIQFLVKNNMQHAELRLDPPELGKIQVKISLAQDQANVSFASTHGNVRDAIEQALPRLRELLNESGIQLGNADVASQFQQKNGQASQQEDKPAVSMSYAHDEESDIKLAHQPRMEYAVNGVIDYFA